MTHRSSAGVRASPPVASLGVWLSGRRRLETGGVRSGVLAAVGVLILAGTAISYLGPLRGTGDGTPPPFPTPTTRTSGPAATGTPVLPPPDGSATPTSDVTSTDPAIAAFKDACVNETRTLTRAVLSYREEVELQVGKAERYELSIADPDLVPSPSLGTEQEEVAVGCTVEARLVASGTDLSVEPAEWAEQQFVAPQERTWTWLVTASTAGTSAAILQVRPVIRVSTPDGSMTRANLGTEEFPVSFVAARSVEDVASSAWKLLIALAAGIVTLVAAYFAIRRFRGRNDPTRAEPDEDVRIL